MVHQSDEEMILHWKKYMDFKKETQKGQDLAVLDHITKWGKKNRKVKGKI